MFAGVTVLSLSAQETKPAQDAKPVEEFKASGKVDGRIYADAFKTINQPETGALNSSIQSGLELKRAYLGYTYQFTSAWSGRVLLDLSNEVANVDRGVYVKNAFAQYKKGDLKATFGIQDTYNFILHDKIFGKRYLQNPYYDQFKYYTSADLGVTGEYTLGNYSVDLSVYNGEGFRRVQSDNAYRTGLGVTGKFIDKKLTVRFMGDYLSKEYQQSSLSAFAAYQVADKFTLGGEFDFQYHPDYSFNKATTGIDLTNKATTKTTYTALTAQDKNHYGYSLFGTYYVNKTWNVFARYDYVTATSFTDANAYGKTNFLTGNQIISGIEYVYSKSLRFAADYQGFNSELAATPVVSKLFIHAEVSF